MTFFQFCYLRRLVFDQSSPVHPVSESIGFGLSRTEDGGGQTEILVSHIGCVPQKNTNKHSNIFLKYFWYVFL